MSIGTRTGAAPANRMTPDTVPVFAASMAIVSATRGVAAAPCGDFDLLHPQRRIRFDARRSAALDLNVIARSLGFHRSTHRRDDRLGEFRGRGRAADIAGKGLLLTIDILQRLVHAVSRLSLAQMPQHQHRRLQHGRGLAIFFPAMSGAEPCTASKMAHSWPRFAPGTSPSPPTNAAHRSEMMSPYKFSSS